MVRKRIARSWEQFCKIIHVDDSINGGDLVLVVECFGGADGAPRLLQHLVDAQDLHRIRAIKKVSRHPTIEHGISRFGPS